MEVEKEFKRENGKRKRNKTTTKSDETTRKTN